MSPVRFRPQPHFQKSEVEFAALLVCDIRNHVSFKRVIGSALTVFLALGVASEIGICAEPDTKLVTRIDIAKAVLKNGKLTLRIDAMAPTPPVLIPKGGKLVRRGDKPNKDGLIEYDLYFKPGGYSGTKLRLVKASLTEHVPPDTKGARIFAELNHVDALPAPPKGEKNSSTPTPSPTPTPSATP